MCDPCCLFVGFNSRSKLTDRPEEYEQLPDKILCPHCSAISRPVYRKDDYVFNICFIPLFPCWSSRPYLSCENCRRKVSMIRGNPCRSCHVSHTVDAEYCPNCGTKCNMESRSLHLSQ